MMEDVNTLSLQERFAPASVCFGCGPANPHGLHIRSFVEGDEVVTEWMPDAHHHAFPGALHGGIIASLFDCHCNWTAAHALMRAAGGASAPATVTAEICVTFRRPTPDAQPVRIRARVAALDGSRVIVDATLESAGEVRASCRGTFVAVKPGHPAFHRW